MTSSSLPEDAFEAGLDAIARGELEEAQRLFHRACGARPDTPRYQLYRAWTQHQRVALGSSRIPNAEQTKKSCRITMVDALLTEPDDREGFVLLGTVLLSEGQVELARACFVRVLDANPDHAGARLGLESCDLA